MSDVVFCAIVVEKFANVVINETIVVLKIVDMVVVLSTPSYESSVDMTVVPGTVVVKIDDTVVRSGVFSPAAMVYCFNWSNQTDGNVDAR